MRDEKVKTIQRPTAEVNTLKDKLIKTLQDYCRSQVDLWRQVPALAREADKLKYHISGRYQMAYLSGYWPISKFDIHGLWVDLQTGEFGRVQLFNEIKLGDIDSILRGLDADEVISSLKSEIESLSVDT